MLSSPVSSSSLFASLPARPPTPPRDISKDVDDAFRFLEEGHHDDSTTQPKSSRVTASADTPPQQSAASIQARASTAEKRVDFSPFPTVHDLPQASHSGSPAPHAKKETPLKHQTKPLKSILKASNDRLPLTPDDLESKLSYFSPQEPGSFRKMLQSVLAQLASQSRDDRRDAYLAINGAMKTYDGVPDPEALCEKMAFIQQFIARDLAWKDPTGRVDFSIVSQALTLVLGLLQNSETEAALDDDFRNLLIERSMVVIEHDDMNKGVYKLHMYLLSQQRFKSHILTAARADRLITALYGCEDRCSGNGVVSSRLIVYSRLLKQAPSTMLTRMRDWIEFPFHGMLSSILDVRIRAIDTCVQAGLILGDQAQTAKVMYEIAEKEEEEGQSYGDYLNSRLKEMSADKELAKWVPQIWSAIILLFRCKRRPVEKWPCFKDWLTTIQRSLNSADTEVKHHANIAWNKLVFAVMPGSATTESMRSMLRIPIMAGLEKRGNDRVSQQHRQIAMDSYCNLLHYGLRPGLTHEELDQAWDLYVDPILSKMAQSSSRAQQHTVCCVLQGLLKKGAGVWNKNAANEPGAIKPSDLPRLEPRWVRSRLFRVIRIMEHVITSGMWITPDANEAANTCWRLLLDSVAEAGSQEVKASNELKEAIAHLTNFFRRVWNGDWKSRNEIEGHVWLDRFHVLLETAINCLGPVPFVEDVLSKTSEDDLEAAPTPSHRTAKHSVVAYPAFVFLFTLYYQAPSPLRTSGLYKSSATTFLRILASAKGSVSGTLALLHRVLQFSASAAEQSDVAGQLWNVVAHEAAEVLQDDKSAMSQRDAQLMGNALRSAVNIILNGLRYADSSPGCLDMAVELYGAACMAGKHHANDGGVVLGVMEPFSKSVIELLDELPINTGARMAQQMLQNGVWPKSRQELDHSRKVLWTVSLELPRTPVFDPFEHLYGFLNGLLVRSYEKLSHADDRTTQMMCSVMRSLSDFLRRCPLAVLAVALRKTQSGIVPWIEDYHRVLFPLNINLSDQPRSNIIETAATCIFDMWSDLTLLLEAVPRKDSSLLLSLEPLLAAGFASPSRDIVNKTISFWNASFGGLLSLEYPTRMQAVLRARRLEADLELPGFPDSNDEAEVADLPAFAESQQNVPDRHELANFTSSTSSRPTSRHLRDNLASNDALFPPLASRNVLRLDRRLVERDGNHTRPAALHITSVQKAKSNKDSSSVGSTPRARLRHDDSQIDFAPIDSTLPRPADENESQLLTEHQKEVQTRQRGDAQMYPELSSSPMAHADSRTRRIAKKLDFGSSSGQEEHVTAVTPTGMLDANPMSDDLPSSPTPRSNAVSRADGSMTQYNEDDEETVCDPPSSPPRAEDQAQPLFLDVPEVIVNTETRTAKDTSHYQNQRSGPELHDIGTADLPSDTMLPTDQLQREAAAANTDADDEDDNDIAIISSTAQHEPSNSAKRRRPASIGVSASHETMAISESQATEPQQILQGSPQTPSRIEDSMIEHDGVPDSTPASSESSTPLTRGQRKRKRNNELVSTKPAKRRNKSSPFRLWDRLRGSREDNKDDIEDEIVVASSQQSTSPQPLREDSTSSRPRAESQEEPLCTFEQGDEPPALEVPPKRKPGRPRKSASQPKGEAGSTSTKTLKRSASVLSTASSKSHLTTSVVGETPAVPRTRKSARLLQDAEVPSSTRNVILDVLPPALPAGQSIQQTEMNAPDEEAMQEYEDIALSPGQQLIQEEAAATPARRIAQPKSIMGRLRGILADCKEMMFGSPEEEREFDDILFEIRQEVHEAGRKVRGL